MGSRGEAALLQRQGQNLYGQGNWEAAISAFTEALKCPDVDALSVLDNRAATYTKLLQYDQALKDARQIIKRDKKDDRGYLRCAKALLLNGKPEKALEVYAYALKTLPKDHPRYHVVEQMHTKLQAKLVSKCYDPFSVFPLEIARMVVEHFDFKEIVAILRVSKGWDRFLSSMRDLWMRLDFSRARSKIHWSSALACIKRSKAMLTQAVVANLTKASIRRVLEYISRCPNLKHLEILSPTSSKDIYELFKGCKQLEVLLVSSETTVPQSTITRLLSSLPKLERIQIHKATKSLASEAEWPSSLPNLKSITFGTTDLSVTLNHVPALYIPRLIQPSTAAPTSNLTELRLHSNPEVFFPYPPSFNPSDFPSLRKLDMTGLLIVEPFGFPPTLQFLRIRGGAAPESVPFTVDEEANRRYLPPLPNLSTLILSDVPWATSATIHAFIEQAKAPLEVVHIDSCFRVSPFAVISELCKHDCRVSTLNIAHSSEVDDKLVARILEVLPTLKVLNLSATNITGVAVKTIADAREDKDKATVDCVYVNRCEEVSTDAVEYGRSKGVVIVTDLRSIVN
ncbi:hypothetical protein BDV06DRAFT_174170 [Aspergillus oleicola]